MLLSLRLYLYLVLAVSCLSFLPHPPSDQELIIGTWVSNKDKNWKLVFTKDKCSQYYGKEVAEIERYTLANKSPQCGEKVPVEKVTSYLQLTAIKNKEATCYQLYGLTTKNLSISPIRNGGILLFTRSSP
jgi:hypothetical protein